MGKKVLILSASPRKGGNSETLCAAFTRGAQESGHSVEMVRLHGRKMGFCTACYACKKTGVCAVSYTHLSCRSISPAACSPSCLR